MAVGFRLTPEDHIYIRQWMEQSGPNLRRISARETAPAESVSQKPARAANPPGPTKLKTKAVKTTGGATKRGAAAANKGSLTAGVEVLLAPGKTASWKFPIQAGQTADFTFLAQATDPEAGLELCSLSVSDEEGARVGRVEQFVNTSGDEFNKQTLSIDAEEAGTYTATVHSQAEAELRIKLKTKFS